jgi:DNA polymerase-3 subunit delta
MIHGMPGSDEKTIATAIGIHPFFAKDYFTAAKRYNYGAVEKILLLLHHYNLRTVGVHDGGSSEAGLLKELVVKIMQ